MVTASELWQGLVYKRHPLVRDRPLTASPHIVSGVMLAYLLLVLYGPRLMRTRRSPSLKRVLMVYNLTQVMFSSYLMREFWLSRPRYISWLLCSPVDVTTDERSQRLVDACMVFHFTKILDLLDTVFLILKKEHKRMSYLHVYHHGSAVFGFWFATAFVPGGSTWFGGWLNSLVHCVMYGYYLLASLGPRVRPYLWWKRYLTQLQLFQFAIVGTLMIIVETIPARCGFPSWVVMMMLAYLVVITSFFLNFYIHAYVHQPAPAAAAVQPGTTADHSASRQASSGPVAALRSVGNMILTQGPGCYVKQD